jgi:hypothetical protein
MGIQRVGFAMLTAKGPQCSLSAVDHLTPKGPSG